MYRAYQVKSGFEKDKTDGGTDTRQSTVIIATDMEDLLRQLADGKFRAVFREKGFHVTPLGDVAD